MVLQDIGQVLAQLTQQTINFLPNLIGAVILLVIGLVLGKVIGRIVKEVLERVRLDYYVTETEKPVISLSGLFALITRWWIYLAFITTAVSVLEISELTVWMRTILGFVPPVIGAAIAIVVAYILAEFLKGQIKKANTLWSAVVGKVLFFFIMYVAIAIALDILGVSTALINNILIIIIASVGLGIAIALGLGLKDAVTEISKKYVRKLKL